MANSSLSFYYINRINRFSFSLELRNENESDSRQLNPTLRGRRAPDERF